MDKKRKQRVRKLYYRFLGNGLYPILPNGDTKEYFQNTKI